MSQPTMSPKKSVSNNWRVSPWRVWQFILVMHIADQLVWIPSENSSDQRIGWLLRDASALETTPAPPKKKIKAPGGYKPRKTTAVLKRNVSEFCQKKSLIASWKNIILTWLDIGFFCCCFLSNEPLESPQPLTKVLDVLLADSQSKISHIASKRLWLWWSAGFFWGNFRGFFCGPLGPHSKIWGVSILEPQKTPRIFNIAPEK